MNNKPHSNIGTITTDNKQALHNALQKIEQLEAENATLKAWKKQATQVIDNLDLQEIAKVLDIKLGTTISDKILPNILKLQTENAELLELLKIFVEENTPILTSHTYEFPDHMMKAKSLIKKKQNNEQKRHLH